MTETRSDEDGDSMGQSATISQQWPCNLPATYYLLLTCTYYYLIFTTFPIASSLSSQLPFAGIHGRITNGKMASFESPYIQVLVFKEAQSKSKSKAKWKW